MSAVADLLKKKAKPTPAKSVGASVPKVKKTSSAIDKLLAEKKKTSVSSSLPSKTPASLPVEDRGPRVQRLTPTTPNFPSSIISTRDPATPALSGSNIFPTLPRPVPLDSIPSPIKEPKKGLGDLVKRTVASATSQVVKAGQYAVNKIISKPSVLMPNNPIAEKLNDPLSRVIKTVNQPVLGALDSVVKKTEKFAQEANVINPEWEKASLKDKVTKKLPETLYYLAPQVAGSLAPYLVNPALGFGTTVASTAQDVKDKAMKEGMNEERADTLGLATGVAVGALDRIIPSKALGSEAKKQFIGLFVKRLIKSSAGEAGTEMAQEIIQIAAEKTFREDLGWDEAKTRTAMAGLGGLLGGAGIHSVASVIQGSVAPPVTSAPVISPAIDAVLTERARASETPQNEPTVPVQVQSEPEAVPTPKTPFASVQSAPAVQETAVSQLLKKVTLEVPRIDTPGQSVAAREEPIRTKIKYDGTPEQNKLLEELYGAQKGERYVVRSEDKSELEMKVVNSTFPNWIPADLRSKPVVDAVADHIFDGILPTKVAEKRLYNIIAERLKTPEQKQYDPLAAVRNKKNEEIPFLTEEKTQEIKQTEKPKLPLVKQPKQTATSKVGKAIEAKAIEKGLTESFGRTAGYEKMNVKEQSERTADLLRNDLDRAKAIMRGEEDLPDGIKGASLLVGLENYAMETDDANLALEIANSSLTSETSAYAQEMRILAERDPDSAMVALRELKKAKMEGMKTRGVSIDQAARDIRRIVETSKRKIEKGAWLEFIDSIEC